MYCNMITNCNCTICSHSYGILIHNDYSSAHTISSYFL